MKIYQLFVITIGNTKVKEKIVFRIESPVIQYNQQSYNSFCLSNLAPDFHSIGDKMATTDLANHIEEQLTLQKNMFINIFDFNNDIMKKNCVTKINSA